MTEWPKSEDILKVEQLHMSCLHLVAMMLNISTLHSPPLSKLLQKTYFQSLLSVLQSHVSLTPCLHHFCWIVWMSYFHPWLTLLMTPLFLVSFQHSTNLLLLNHFWRNLLLILMTWNTIDQSLIYHSCLKFLKKWLHTVPDLPLCLGVLKHRAPVGQGAPSSWQKNVTINFSKVKTKSKSFS